MLRNRAYGHKGERFVAYFWFVGWWAFSFGVHIDVRSPNVELHLPFGFIRVGRPAKPQRLTPQAFAAARPSR